MERLKAGIPRFYLCDRTDGRERRECPTIRRLQSAQGSRYCKNKDLSKFENKDESHHEKRKRHLTRAMFAMKHLLPYILIPCSILAFPSRGHHAVSFKYSPTPVKLNPFHSFETTVAPRDSRAFVVQPSADSDQEQPVPDRANLLTRFVTDFWFALTAPYTDLRKLMKQRERDATNLMLSLRLREGLIAVMVYLGIGVFAYHKVFEKWSIVDSLYFTVTVFSTVGYGDMAPATVGGKIFTCLFGFTGIAMLGAAIASIGSKLVEIETAAARRAEKLSRKRIVNMYEKLPKLKKAETKKERAKIIQAILSHTPKAPHIPERATSLLQGARWLAQSLMIVAIGGLLLGKVEGWNSIDSLYYAFITASTIGLGDFAPATKAGRLIAGFLIPLTVAAAGEILSSIGLALIEKRQKKLFDSQLGKGLTMKHLEAMDANKDGKVEREEYVLFMLLEMGLVTKHEIDDLFDQFDRLDVTRSGYLNQDDIMLIARLTENQNQNQKPE